MTRRRRKRLVGVCVRGRDLTAPLNCKTRTEAQRVRRALTAWQGKRDLKTLLRLARLAVQRDGCWTRTIIREFTDRKRGAR